MMSGDENTPTTDMQQRGSQAIERLRAVTRTAIDAIVSANAAGLIRDWNPAAETIFGYSVQEALGQPLEILMPRRFRQAHKAGMALAANAGPARLPGTTLEVIGLRKNGEEFPIELSMAKWQAGGEIGFTGIIRDISHRIETMRQLAGLSSLMAEVLTGHVLNGRYRLERPLNVEPGSVLYEASDLEQLSPVWVRILRPPADGRIFMKMAGDFVRPCHPVDHHNAVDVLEQGRSDILLPFIVTESLSGEPLLQALERGHPELVVRGLEWVSQVAQALLAAHEQGISHGDVRPGNIFLHETRGGPSLVKLGNFGLADFCAVFLQRTKSHRARPEEDVFQLGRLALRILGEVEESILDTPDPLRGRLREVRPDLSASLLDLIDSTLHPVEERRPGIAEVAAGLAREVESQFRRRH